MRLLLDEDNYIKSIIYDEDSEEGIEVNLGLDDYPKEYITAYRYIDGEFIADIERLEAMTPHREPSEIETLRLENEVIKEVLDNILMNLI